MHTSIDVSITSKELIQSHLYSGVQSLGVQAKKKQALTTQSWNKIITLKHFQENN